LFTHPLDPKQARPNGSAGHSNPARQPPYSNIGGGLGVRRETGHPHKHTTSEYRWGGSC